MKLYFQFLCNLEMTNNKNLCKTLISDNNQEKIVQEGGLDALLMLLQSSENATILRVASGAIANLAMNGTHDFSLFFKEKKNSCVYFLYLHFNLMKSGDDLAI